MDTVHSVMTIKQFILFQNYIKDKRQLEVKEVESITKITKFAKNYANKVMRSGKNNRDVLLLIQFKSDKHNIKDIELIKIICK